MSRRFAVVLLVLLSACARPPVRDEVTIAFTAGEPETVLVTAQTTFDLQAREARTRADAAQAGTDPWSVRFGRVTPHADEVTYRRNRGILEQVTRSVRVDTRDLQTLFSDTNITINLLRGDGWTELAFYPGASMRATREQQRAFDESLRSWSTDAARYFQALDRLYRYMDLVPSRAPELWSAVFDEETVLLEDEVPLVAAVVHAMDDIASRMDIEERSASLIAEQADLLFNPFPARLTIKVPGSVTSTEGFTDDLTIAPVNLLAAVTALEGRWASPDPLVMLLRDQSPKAEELAERPRQSSSPTPEDIAKAVRDQLTRPKTYVVRWRD